MTAVQITEQAEEKIKKLRLEYKRKHGVNITYQMIVAKLINKAKLKDVE